MTFMYDKIAPAPLAAAAPVISAVAWKHAARVIVALALMAATVWVAYEAAA
jgi:hypothetical protein